MEGGRPIALAATISNGGNRPNVKAGANDQVANQTLAKWFNTDAFLQPDAFTFGNVSRTLPDVLSDGLFNIDLSLYKSFRLRTLQPAVSGGIVQFDQYAHFRHTRPHVWVGNIRSCDSYCLQPATAPDAICVEVGLLMYALDKSLPVPLYHQLKNILMTGIESGEWQPDQQIPTEEDLSKRFGISKITVRQALRELAGLGYIRREQGRGTFVSRPQLVQGPRELTSFTERCAATT